jgi:hypothetical protein
MRNALPRAEFRLQRIARPGTFPNGVFFGHGGGQLRVAQLQ